MALAMPYNLGFAAPQEGGHRKANFSDQRDVSNLVSPPLGKVTSID